MVGGRLRYDQETTIASPGTKADVCKTRPENDRFYRKAKIFEKLKNWGGLTLGE
jgi:hypothetical protein